MLYTGFRWSVFSCADFGGVSAHLATANDVPYIFNLPHTQCTLTQFYVQYMLMEAVKDTSKMTLVLIIASTIYWDIVNVH